MFKKFKKLSTEKGMVDNKNKQLTEKIEILKEKVSFSTKKWVFKNNFIKANFFKKTESDKQRDAAMNDYKRRYREVESYEIKMVDIKKQLSKAVEETKKIREKVSI